MQTMFMLPSIAVTHPRYPSLATAGVAASVSPIAAAESASRGSADAGLRLLLPSRTAIGSPTAFPPPSRLPAPAVKTTELDSKPTHGTKVTVPGSFSLVDHYLDKVPNLLAISISAREQRMVLTSKVTRMALRAMQNPTVVRTFTDDIQLLHPIAFGPAQRKLERRSEIVANALRKGEIADVVSQDMLNKLMPSDEEIQIAKTCEGRYISLQGVGRISAIKRASKAAGRVLSIEVTCFDLSGMPFVASKLRAIAASYKGEEGALSKAIGALLTAGAVAGTGFAAGKLIRTL
jgi:hypothetical protein